MQARSQDTTTKNSPKDVLEEAVEEEIILDFADEEEEMPEATERLTVDCTTIHVCRWLVRILLFFIALFAILVTELLLAPVREISLDSAMVDVSQPLPHATLHVQFQHGSRLSTVTIKSLHCDLEESGAVEFEVMYKEDIGVNSTAATASTSSSYTIHATCPEEDVQAHADLLWRVLTESDTKGNQETSGTETGVGDFKCQLGIRIYFAKLIPYSHTVTIDNTWEGKFKTFASASSSPSSSPSLSASPSQSQSPSGNEKSKNQSSIAPTDTTHIRHPTGFALRQLNIHNLSLAYRIEPPERIKNIVTNLELILPSLNIEATDYETTSSSSLGTTGSINFGRFNASFLSHDMLHDHDEDNWASFLLSCPSSLNCPWFGPVIDWYTRASHAPDGRLVVDVAVNGGESFLERLLGPQHIFYVDCSPGVVDALSTQGHRKAKSAFNEVFLKEAASCLSLASEKIEAFDFAWCWFLNSSEGFQVVGRTDLYDYTMKTIVETQWDLDKNAEKLDILTSLLMEAGEATTNFNISGDLLIDWSGKDTVTVSAKGSNDGTWLPFETALRGNGRWDSVSDRILTLKMEQGHLIFEDDLLADAVGSLVLNTDELTLHVTLNDPAEGLKCDLLGEVLWDAEKFEANSLCEYDGKAVWDMGLDSGIAWNADETRWTVYMEFDEMVSSFKTVASLGSTDDKNGQYSMDIQLDGKQIIEATGGYVFDCDAEVFEFSMDDSGHLDYSAIVKGDWDTSVTDVFAMQIVEMSLRQDQKIHINLKAELTIDLVTDQISISARDINALKFSFDSITRWEEERDEQTDEITVSFDKIFLEWKSGKNIDGTGKLFIDVIDSSSHLELTDNGHIGIFLNVDARWDNDHDSDKFSLYLDRLFIGWENETRADLTGNLAIDLQEQPGLVGSLRDESILEVNADVDVRWPDLEGVFVLLLDCSSVVFKDEIILDASGSLELRDDSIEIKFDDPNGLGAKGHGLLFWVNDAYTQYFSLVLETLKLEWDGNAKVDLSANVTLDEDIEVTDSTFLYPRWSLQMTAQNTASPTFLATLGMTDATPYTNDNGVMISNPDQRRLSIERVAFQFDDESYFDQEVVFEYDNGRSGLMLTVYCASEVGADLEMNMNMTIAFHKDADTALRMIIDHMNMGWRGTSWIDAGDSLKATESEESSTDSPSQSPPNQNETPDATDVPSQSPPNQKETPDATDVPSQSPSTQNEATDSTDLPSLSPSSENAAAAHVTIEIQGIIMRLVGAEELNEKGKNDFSETLETFYVNNYSVTIRRYLADVSTIAFQTDVTVTGQEPDISGNTITYNQKLTSPPGSKENDVTAAEELLLKPLLSAEGKAEFVRQLQALNADAFGSVTSVHSPKFAEESETTKSPGTLQGNQTKEQPEKNSNALVIAVSTVSAVLLCCGGFGYYYWSRLQKSRSADESIGHALEDPSHGTPLIATLQTEAFCDKRSNEEISSNEEVEDDCSNDDEGGDAFS